MVLDTISNKLLKLLGRVPLFLQSPQPLLNSSEQQGPFFTFCPPSFCKQLREGPPFKNSFKIVELALITNPPPPTLFTVASWRGAERSSAAGERLDASLSTISSKRSSKRNISSF